MTNDIKNKIFRMIQDYLKKRVLIIWGSGATIPFGMPSMEDIKKHLNLKQKGNLEDILSEISPEDQETHEIKFYKFIDNKDSAFRKKLEKNERLVKPLKEFICYFYEAEPNFIKIITTNYDCILEYVFSLYDIPYSDGFTGKEFSKFSVENFKEKEHINLYKVHGSLRWYKQKYKYHNLRMDGVLPGKDKFRTITQDPFRTLIQKSDDAIKEANCFLSVGFGFNDEHLTPKLEEVVTNNQKSIVIIAKKATESIKRKIVNFDEFMLIEQYKNENKTNFQFRENGNIINNTLEGKYWEIDQFNKILKGE